MQNFTFQNLSVKGVSFKSFFLQSHILGIRAEQALPCIFATTKNLSNLNVKHEFLQKLVFQGQVLLEGLTQHLQKSNS